MTVRAGGFSASATLVSDGAGNCTATSGSNAVLAGAFVYLTLMFGSAAGAAPSFTTPTNSGTALTWQLVDSYAPGTVEGAVAVWKAFNAAAQTITITAGATGIGAVAAGNVGVMHGDFWYLCDRSQTGAAITKQTTTATNNDVAVATSKANSRVCLAHYNGTNGSNAPGTTDTAGAAWSIGTTGSGLSAYKAADSGAPGSYTINVSTTAGPSNVMLAYEIIGAQVAVPDADVSAGTWSPSTGTDLYATLDEVPPSFADYIFSSLDGNSKVSLAPLSAPRSGAQSLRLTARGSPAKKLVARLLEGANVRGTLSIDPLTTSDTHYAADIGGTVVDYTALDVDLTISAATTPGATLSFGAAGAFAYSTSGGTVVSPVAPACQSGDQLLLILGQKPSAANGGTAATPSGWTLVGSLTGAGGYGATLGADTGNTNLFVFSRTANGTEAGNPVAVTVAVNGVCWAQIIAASSLTPALASWSVAMVTGSDTTAGSVSVAFGSNPGVQIGDLVVGAMCIPTDVTTPAQFSAEAFTQAGVTFGAVTEIGEADSTTGNDIGGFVCYALATAGSATGAPTMTATAGGTTTNVRGPAAFIRLRNDAINRVSWVAFETPAIGGNDVAGFKAWDGGAWVAKPAKAWDGGA
jgi:hypothetical protein